MKNCCSKKHILICLALFVVIGLFFGKNEVASYVPLLGFLLCPLIMLIGMKFMRCDQPDQKQTDSSKNV